MYKLNYMESGKEEGGGTSWKIISNISKMIACKQQMTYVWKLSGQRPFSSI